MASSYTSSPKGGTDIDFDDNDSLDFDDDRYILDHNSDEGTEIVVLKLGH